MGVTERGLCILARQKQFRAAGIAARNAIVLESRARFDAAICQNLLELPMMQSVHTILSYAPMPNEANVAAFNAAAQRLGKRVAYPDCVDNVRMEARVPLDDAAWTVGKLHIPTPDRARSVLVDPAELDCVLVPCTAFDDRCNRVGMGAGYYDRYLARCMQALLCIVAYDEQRVKEIELQAHDFPCDMAVTQSGYYAAKRGRP